MCGIFSCCNDLLDSLLPYVSSHAVVCEPSRVDHLRMVSKSLCLVGEIVGIDADAMASYKPRIELEEVPFCSCSFKNFKRVYTHTVENNRKLVHESDVDITLGVLYDLGRLGYLY